jgi:quinolinate synthase
MSFSKQFKQSTDKNWKSDYQRLPDSEKTIIRTNYVVREIQTAQQQQGDSIKLINQQLEQIALLLDDIVKNTLPKQEEQKDATIKEVQRRK